MAFILANDAFNFDLLDLSRLLNRPGNPQISDDVNLELGDRVFEDIATFHYFGGTDRTAIIGGYGFKGSAKEGLTAGTVTGYMELNGKGEPSWMIEGFKVGAADLYKAMRTKSRDDDRAIFEKILSKSDTFLLSDHADTAYGGGGNDMMMGKGGNDVLDGGTGDDILVGGAGNDDLRGDSGRDTFVFDAALNSRTNVDVIRDFDVRFDRIQLDPSVFTSLKERGELLASHFRASTSGLPADRTDYILYETDTGKLFYDADGSGKKYGAVQIALLAGKPKLTADDFIVRSFDFDLA